MKLVSNAIQNVSACVVAAACTLIAAQVEAQQNDYSQTNSDALQEARGTGRGVRLGSGYANRVIPESHLVRRGDTLWDITGRYYGNPWYWPRVWSYNPEITNPHWIYPQAVVRLRPHGDQRDVTPTGFAVRSRGYTDSGEVFLRDEGYLDPDALRGAGRIVGAPEEHMLLSPYDEVYLQFEQEPSFAQGHELTVFRQIEPDDRAVGEQGNLVRIYGTIRYEDYDRERHIARGTIIEALDPIERGFRVADVPRRFANVAPRENERDLEAHVIAVLRPRSLIHDNFVLFIDVGAEQGVRAGNRFFVLREGDDWRENMTSQNPRNMGASEDELPEAGELPPQIIAEARVVDVRRNSSACFVTREIREVELNDRLEMRRGY